MLWPDDWEGGETGDEPGRGAPSPSASARDATAGEGTAEVRLDFHGSTFALQSDQPEVSARLERDFAYFRAALEPETADARLTIRVAEPPWDWLPALPAVRATDSGVAFTDGTTDYVEYFAGALAILEHGPRRGEIYARRPELAYDVTRRLVLARVSRALEARGLHPVDALAVSDRGRGIVVLPPPGCDRRTLARELLARPGFFLLGEQASLLDRHGRLLALPLRAADFAGCPGRLGDVAGARLLLVGERSSGRDAAIVPTSKPVALRALVKHMSSGLLEAAPELGAAPGPLDALATGGLLASRVASALRVLARVRPYRFVLVRERAENLRALHAFLDGVEPSAHAW